MGSKNLNGLETPCYQRLEAVHKKSLTERPCCGMLSPQQGWANPWPIGGWHSFWPRNLTASAVFFSGRFVTVSQTPAHYYFHKNLTIKPQSIMPCGNSLAFGLAPFQPRSIHQFQSCSTFHDEAENLEFRQRRQQLWPDAYQIGLA